MLNSSSTFNIQKTYECGMIYRNSPGKFAFNCLFCKQVVLNMGVLFHHIETHFASNPKQTINLNEAAETVFVNVNGEPDSEHEEVIKIKSEDETDGLLRVLTPICICDDAQNGNNQKIQEVHVKKENKAIPFTNAPIVIESVDKIASENHENAEVEPKHVSAGRAMIPDCQESHIEQAKEIKESSDQPKNLIKEEKSKNELKVLANPTQCTQKNLFQYFSSKTIHLEIDKCEKFEKLNEKVDKLYSNESGEVDTLKSNQLGIADRWNSIISNEPGKVHKLKSIKCTQPGKVDQLKANKCGKVKFILVNSEYTENSVKLNEICHICGVALSKKTFQIHMRKHTDEEPYKCDECGHTFKQKYSLRNHKLYHIQNGSGKPNETIQLHRCDICKNVYRQLKSLIEHRQSHTSEKPYKCTACNMAFPRALSLRNHSLIHKNCKQFQCRHCEQSFTQASARYYHEKRMHNKLTQKNINWVDVKKFRFYRSDLGSLSNLSK